MKTEKYREEWEELKQNESFLVETENNAQELTGPNGVHCFESLLMRCKLFGTDRKCG